MYRISNLLFACLLVVSTDVLAGSRELADQGDNYGPPINNPGDGQMWPSSLDTSLAGTIPFALDFGSGAVSNRTFSIDPHGRLDFTTSLSGTTKTGDFVDILYNSAASFTPLTSISHDIGLVDPSLIDSTLAPQFSDKSKGLSVYRALFNFVCPTNDPNCSQLGFETTFVYLNDSTFILQFNYGFNFFDATDPTSEFLTGFQLGTGNAASFSGTYSQSGPDFCFSNGVERSFTTIANCIGSTSTSTTVAEPDVGSMLLLGSVGLAFGVSTARRRKAKHRA